MMLGFVLFVVFVRFTCMVQNIWLLKKDMVDQYSNYCFVDLY